MKTGGRISTGPEFKVTSGGSMRWRGRIRAERKVKKVGERERSRAMGRMEDEEQQKNSFSDSYELLRFEL